MQYLSPQPREIKGFDAPAVAFTSGSRLAPSQSARTALSRSTFDSRIAVKPVRASNLTKSWSMSRNVRDLQTAQSISRSDTITDVEAEGSSGKRRRTEFGQDTIVESTDSLPAPTPASDNIAPPASSINTSQALAKQPTKLTTTFKFGAGSGLRKPLTNPTPSPAVPSPLRFVTQASEFHDTSVLSHVLIIVFASGLALASSPESDGRGRNEHYQRRQ